MALVLCSIPDSLSPQNKSVTWVTAHPRAGTGIHPTPPHGLVGGRWSPKENGGAVVRKGSAVLGLPQHCCPQQGHLVYFSSLHLPYSSES